MDVFFCCTSLRDKNYIEFIKYRHKNKSSYGKFAEGATLAILVLWLGLTYYYNDIGEFSMPLTYILILSQLLFQKLYMFIFKLALFPIALLIFLL